MMKTYHKLYLDEVNIDGFKSIDQLNVKLNQGLNILIGRNGSGKSNFLESLNDGLSNSGFRRAGFKSAVFKFIAEDESIIDLQLEKLSKVPEQEFIDDSVEDFDRRIKTAIKIFINEERVYDNVRNIMPVLNGRGTPTSSLGVVFRRISYERLLPKYLTFHIPQKLECIDIAGTVTADYDSDGDVTWSEVDTLWFVERTLMDLESNTSYEQDEVKALTKKSILDTLIVPENIKESLKIYSPISDVRYGENINLYHDDKGLTIENIKLEFFINKTWLPWSQLSDGTKRIFYIIVEVLAYSKSLILLEEPELGVHPHQFCQIMNFLREASIDRQIIISTHSPIALNHLEPDELDKILIAKYDLKKGTQIKHLTPSQKKKGKIYMSKIGQLSDFWMLSDLE